MKKVQTIVGVASISVGLVIMILQIPDLLNNKQANLQMLLVGIGNVILGLIFFTGIYKRKKNSNKQNTVSKTDAGKGIIITVLLFIVIAIITAFITQNYLT